MTENIAILLGNRKYKNLNDLDCVGNDVAEMKKLISATGKFSNIYCYLDRPISEVKDDLKVLAKSHTQTGELFFYFSGHGVSDQDNFYMCFSDFNEVIPNRSGLSRDEAYDILREFNPKQAVIVIDACASGANLIKSGANFLEAAPKGKFNDFLQIGSCLNDQSSRAGEELSRFTDAFIESALIKESGVVYYSDIESGLRDAFKSLGGQTPHFVSQGTGLAEFCGDANSLSSLRAEFFLVDEKSEIVEPPEVDAVKVALAEIERIDAEIPEQKEAQAFIDGVFQAGFEDGANLDDLSGIFEQRIVKYDDYTHVDNYQAIYNLLQQRPGNDVFVEARRWEKNPKSRGSFIDQLTMPALFPDPIEYSYSLENLCELDSVHVGIYFEPKRKSLNRVFSEIVFIPRLTECLILTSNTIELRSGWDSFKPSTSRKEWKWSHHKWAADPSEVVFSEVQDPYDFLRSYVLRFSSSRS
ncbi:caspase family protein [Salipiger marinus]|uniref:Caspase domain-containing protein n=1 Tax=Salipiger marinus TaxID=555512 RepID=A0A1G8MRE6_9RHOB|nr:caspase family protein [Salipiger marinus]SDI70628.1 Caspase domain-containing protein [Salipiger marinus]